MINIFQQLANYIVVLLSLSTACGVLLHDTGIDKAVSSVLYKIQSSDPGTDTVKIRPGSNLHPHAEHMTVKKDVRNPDMLPRKRVSKKIEQNTDAKRLGCGYHGDGVCMPLAGEWT